MALIPTDASAIVRGSVKQKTVSKVRRPTVALTEPDAGPTSVTPFVFVYVVILLFTTFLLLFLLTIVNSKTLSNESSDAAVVEWTHGTSAATRRHLDDHVKLAYVQCPAQGSPIPALKDDWRRVPRGRGH
ncbi:hypothetical protein MRX96_032905 [Rhipicephalus microplus]